MRHIPAILIGVLAAAPAMAEEMPIVVELFTSQGCSACPPADAVMRELATMDGVIALSLHVDYWDYIGWPDSFAKPAHSVRQEAYARAAGERMVYTPQIVVNGMDRVIGGDAMAVMEQLHAHAGTMTPVALRLSREGSKIRIEATTTSPMPPLTVHLVRFNPSETVTIPDGENAGMIVDYTNIVTGWEVVGSWSSETPLSLDVPADGPDGIAVLLQEEGPSPGSEPGPIRAAALLP